MGSMPMSGSAAEAAGILQAPRLVNKVPASRAAPHHPEPPRTIPHCAAAHTLSRATHSHAPRRTSLHRAAPRQSARRALVLCLAMGRVAKRGWEEAGKAGEAGLIPNGVRNPKLWYLYPKP